MLLGDATVLPMEHKAFGRRSESTAKDVIESVKIPPPLDVRDQGVDIAS